jgi:hypothetical protein
MLSAVTTVSNVCSQLNSTAEAPDRPLHSESTRTVPSPHQQSINCACGVCPSAPLPLLPSTLQTNDRAAKARHPKNPSAGKQPSRPLPSFLAAYLLITKLFLPNYAHTPAGRELSR